MIAPFSDFDTPGRGWVELPQEFVDELMPGEEKLVRRPGLGMLICLVSAAAFWGPVAAIVLF